MAFAPKSAEPALPINARATLGYQIILNETSWALRRGGASKAAWTLDMEPVQGRQTG